PRKLYCKLWWQGLALASQTATSGPQSVSGLVAARYPSRWSWPRERRSLERMCALQRSAYQLAYGRPSVPGRSTAQYLYSLSASEQALDSIQPAASGKVV